MTGERYRPEPPRKGVYRTVRVVDGDKTYVMHVDGKAYEVRRGGFRRVRDAALLDRIRNAVRKAAGSAR